MWTISQKKVFKFKTCFYLWFENLDFLIVEKYTNLYFIVITVYLEGSLFLTTIFIINPTCSTQKTTDFTLIAFSKQKLSLSDFFKMALNRPFHWPISSCSFTGSDCFSEARLRSLLYFVSFSVTSTSFL